MIAQTKPRGIPKLIPNHAAPSSVINPSLKAAIPTGMENTTTTIRVNTAAPAENKTAVTVSMTLRELNCAITAFYFHSSKIENNGSDTQLCAFELPPQLIRCKHCCS